MIVSGLTAAQETARKDQHLRGEELRAAAIRKLRVDNSNKPSGNNRAGGVTLARADQHGIEMDSTGDIAVNMSAPPPRMVSNSGLNNVRRLGSWKEIQDILPQCFVEEEYDTSGIQYATRFRFGLTDHDVMLDGGSGGNSTTEELVLQLVNENAGAGIRIGDPRHPI